MNPFNDPKMQKLLDTMTERMAAETIKLRAEARYYEAAARVEEGKDAAFKLLESLTPVLLPVVEKFIAESTKGGVQ